MQETKHSDTLWDLNDELKMMAQLADEIDANDWTIAKDEITERKLIKQTPRYKVFKADWFGDVIVYEPIRKHSRTKSTSEITIASGANECSEQALDHDDFRVRLDELCRGGRDCTSGINGYSIDSEQGVDSAYSSLSSTPQYYTKHNPKHEFEFPSLSNETQHTEVYTKSRVSRKSSPTSPSVVLNKDSFPFGLESNNEEAHHAIKTDESNYDCSSTKTEATTSGWFELNELRLVAHENFMLFMGASIENSTRDMNDQLEQTTSLVMQMSNPKSVSLHDLLHADKTSNAGSPAFSPTNRFFTSYQCRRELARRQLTIEAKLNICQQVTDAMTYLHDKNIVHGRLTSTNVYIEPNQQVKISLIDTDERQIVSATVCSSRLETTDAVAALENSSDENQPPVAVFNLPTLTYLSPELIRTITLEPTSNSASQQQANEIRMDTSLLTKEADVFSFGTLLFELFEERFPFSEMIKPRPKSPATTTKLVNALCLDSPTTPRSNYYFGLHDCFAQPSSGHKSTISETNQAMKITTENWNGNIKPSASQLIYQIGSGQIAKNNNLTEIGQKYPALVEHIIAACWQFQLTNRPSFKQLRFE